MTARASNRRHHWFRRFGAVAASLGLLVQMGCYQYQPTGGVSPAVGQQVRVSLTDAGRAQLSDQLGESIDWVQGTLAAVDTASLTVDVATTRNLRGGYATWFGDRVQLPTRGVNQVTVREFSRGRSWLLAGGIVAGLVVVSKVLSLAVFGDGRPGEDPSCIPPLCPEA